MLTICSVSGPGYQIWGMEVLSYDLKNTALRKFANLIIAAIAADDVDCCKQFAMLS